MNINITISEKNYKFLKEFMQKVNTQDNRITASPYYYTVCCVRDVGVPEGCGDDVKYYDNQQAESYSEEELKQICKEHELDFDEYVDKWCTKYDCREIDEYENIFFTEDGYKEHMRLNEHNYRHYKKHYSYIKHAFRNPELVELFKALGEITGEGWNKH